MLQCSWAAASYMIVDYIPWYFTYTDLIFCAGKLFFWQSTNPIWRSLVQLSWHMHLFTSDILSPAHAGTSESLALQQHLVGGGGEQSSLTSKTNSFFSPRRPSGQNEANVSADNYRCSGLGAQGQRKLPMLLNKYCWQKFPDQLWYSLRIAWAWWMHFVAWID